jgi:hypothetical protein
VVNIDQPRADWNSLVLGPGDRRAASLTPSKKLISNAYDLANGERTRVSLETGSGEAFAAAVRLYTNFGFEPCGPFGDYTDDPFSRYFMLSL